MWFQKAEGNGGTVFVIRQLQEKSVSSTKISTCSSLATPRVLHGKLSCTLGNPQQAWMSTLLCTDHTFFQPWYALEDHKKWCYLWLFPSVKQNEARLGVCPNTVQSPRCQDAFLNWGRCQNSIPHRWQYLPSAWGLTLKWSGQLLEISYVQINVHT